MNSKGLSPSAQSWSEADWQSLERGCGRRPSRSASTQREIFSFRMPLPTFTRCDWSGGHSRAPFPNRTRIPAYSLRSNASVHGGGHVGIKMPDWRTLRRLVQLWLLCARLRLGRLRPSATVDIDWKTVGQEQMYLPKLWPDFIPLLAEVGLLKISLPKMFLIVLWSMLGL